MIPAPRSSNTLLTAHLKSQPNLFLELNPRTRIDSSPNHKIINHPGKPGARAIIHKPNLQLKPQAPPPAVGRPPRSNARDHRYTVLYAHRSARSASRAHKIAVALSRAHLNRAVSTKSGPLAAANYIHARWHASMHASDKIAMNDRAQRDSGP